MIKNKTFSNVIVPKEYYFNYKTSIGNITISCDKNAITSIGFNLNIKQLGEKDRVSLLDEAFKELEEYLYEERKEFDIPLSPKGTQFQKNVWKALCTIPYGETRSYSQIAKIIGNAKASRAVGMANNKNPILIFIPCHRVIGKNGSLVGYASGLKLKKMLLDLEKTHK